MKLLTWLFLFTLFLGGCSQGTAPEPIRLDAVGSSRVIAEFPQLTATVTAEKLHIRNAPNGVALKHYLKAGNVVTVQSVVMVGDFAWCQIAAAEWAACKYLIFEDGTK